jgi:hypothetical protein
VLPASTTGGGQCFAFPDVCNTPAPPGPPVPIPYPNIGMVMQATNTATKVKMCQKPVVTKKSEMSMSQGDEAGVAGGVVSGRNMDKVAYRKGSSKVKVEGQECEFLSAMTGQNGSNANMPAGNQIAPSQTKVLVSM